MILSIISLWKKGIWVLDYSNYFMVWNAFLFSTGAVYGRGVVFARDVVYPICYPLCKDCGRRRMFLARVLVGRYCVGNQSMVVPSPKSPLTPQILYDSVVNNSSSPWIFVVFYDNKLHYEYLITFQWLYGLMYFRRWYYRLREKRTD